MVEPGRMYTRQATQKLSDTVTLDHWRRADVGFIELLRLIPALKNGPCGYEISTTPSGTSDIEVTLWGVRGKTALIWFHTESADTFPSDYVVAQIAMFVG